MNRAVASFLLLLALSGQCFGARTYRVRKELRSLTDVEYRAFITGLSVMNTLSTASGRRLFGPKYISYTELIVKHAVATNDPRGDQGHNGPPFMTFHRAFLLELEESLLAVAPAMKALPYWDLTLDNPGAKYHGTPNTMFSPKFAGREDGNTSANNAVTTGVFAWRQVPRFIPQQWQQYAQVYNGSSKGFMRGPTNALTTFALTRFPTQNLVDAIRKATKANDTSLPFAKLPAVQFDPDYLVSESGDLLLVYPRRNYLRCLDTTKYKTWMEWNFCIDVTVLATAPDSVDKTRYLNPVVGTTALLHAAVHWTTGGMSASGKEIGDMFDVSTSPNEPLLFPTHHANLDRSALTWQYRAAKAKPSMVADYWFYPKTKSEYSTANNGTLLANICNSNAPFTTLFAARPANPRGYTHREILHHTRPGASPYIYDTMVPEFGSLYAR